MKNKEIEIKDNTAIYRNNACYNYVILMEPRINFNSIQSSRVKFDGDIKLN